MEITSLIAEIRKELGDEAVAKVNAQLGQIERGFKNVVDDLHNANAESKGRKEKIRELTAEIDKNKENLTEIETLKNTIQELTEYKTKFSEYQKQQESAKRKEWEDLSSKIFVPETDKNYEKLAKIQDKFLKANDEESLTIGQIDENLKTYNLLDSAGFFGEGFNIPENRTPRGGEGGGLKDPLDLD